MESAIARVFVGEEDRKLKFEFIAGGGAKKDGKERIREPDLR